MKLVISFQHHVNFSWFEVDPLCPLSFLLFVFGHFFHHHTLAVGRRVQAHPVVVGQARPTELPVPHLARRSRAGGHRLGRYPHVWRARRVPRPRQRAVRWTDRDHSRILQRSVKFFFASFLSSQRMPELFLTPHLVFFQCQFFNAFRLRMRNG